MLFSLGKIAVTVQAMEKIPTLEIAHALACHSIGDWGVINKADWKANDDAVSGDRILSAYISEDGYRFWIITEWDRSVTTVLLPEEY